MTYQESLDLTLGQELRTNRGERGHLVDVYDTGISRLCTVAFDDGTLVQTHHSHLFAR